MPPKFVRSTGSTDYTGARDIERRALLDGDSDDEDFFLKGPKVQTSTLRSDPRMSHLKNQVGDVMDVMKTNVNKVIDRGDRLEDLQDKSDSLAGSADMFRSRSKSLHTSMWWKNCRMRILIAIVIIIVILVITIPIIVHFTNQTDSSTGN